MPTITFSVDLETPLRNSHAPVSDLRTESDNFKNTRISWFPNNLLGNRTLAHGATFTVSGKEAVYLKDNFTTGDYAFLSVVSEGLTFTTQGEAI